MTPDPIIPARFRSGQIPHNVTRPRRHPMTAARTLGLLLLTTAAAAAAPRGPLSFARDIRPILSNNCVMCHGPDEAERKGGPSGSGGLRLDTEEGARMLLDGGKKAVVPGHPEHSDIIARITSTDPDDVMPPPQSAKKITADEIALLSQWITEGAGFSKHWSYEKPVRVEPPKAGIHPVDAFVLDRLEREKLTPQAEADRETLARRAALDLTGLPPSPEQVMAFVHDQLPQAYERFVDTLLASPAYGEHWARQWLDLARYADSAGYADDPARTIWAYRDYVIKSFNANKPFDQFTLEQIAGDLLPEPSEEQLTATAFHRNTMTNSEGGTNDEEFRNAAVVDRVNTTLATWMGTSMACAQCHTHKYDPITHAEYFQVFAFFNNTADADQRDEAPLLSLFSDTQKQQREKIEAELAAINTRLHSPTPALQAAATEWAAGFPITPEWQSLHPTALRSKAGLSMSQEPDGTITVPATAATDTYEIDTIVTAGPPLTALRLEALPHASLPHQGPGHAGGNFVVTRIQATVIPPATAPAPSARYVRIELPGKARILQLAEVEVISQGTNTALKGTATQKSTYADAHASRAIDGTTDGEYTKGSVSHTADGTDDPWWEVDLLSAQPLEKIVVWNRVETAERLEGFRLVALDENRQPVWEKSSLPAARTTAFNIDGGRPLPLAGAMADYSQPDFDEDAVAGDTPSAASKTRKKERGSQKGWAIGGAPGTAHDLTLFLSAPAELTPGSTLRVTIDQQSAFANHTLGRFRLSATSDPAITSLQPVPPRLAQDLARPASERDEASRARLTAFYLEEISPELAADREATTSLRAQLDSMPPVTVPVFRELPPDQHRTTHIQLRGNYLTPGDTVTAGVPAAWHPLPADAPKNRLTLARWLVDENNPLTARVIANRYWESLFGLGLVRTSEEFGAQGDQPSHPELLDWLATELVRQKWDLKSFLKLIVTSSTYRQSSKLVPGAAERDPENRLLARGPRVRLTAEMVRDQALAASGLLSAKMFGPPVRPVRPSLGLAAAFGGGLDWQPSEGEDRLRRGLYTEWRRTSPYPSMTTFDAPNREVCTLRRSPSNTPLQALVTMNDPVFVEAAQALARRVATKTKSPAQVIHDGFQLVLARSPSTTESQRLLALREQALAFYRQEPTKAADMATQPVGPLPPDADPVELAAWTTVASVLLNLDETLMKR